MPSSKLLFVTGTDTEVGKTYTSIAVIKELLKYFEKPLAIKLVESGVDVLSREEEDGVRLANASAQLNPSEALIRLKNPLAAPMAAEIEGRSEEIASWKKFWCDSIRDFMKTGDFVLVEGAGGLLSPLTWNDTMLDLMIEFREQSSVLLVAPNRLGMMSQTLATISCLRNHSINLTGLVVNYPVKGDHSSDTNVKALLSYSGLESIKDLPIFIMQNGAENLVPENKLADILRGEGS